MTEFWSSKLTMKRLSWPEKRADQTDWRKIYKNKKTEKNMQNKEKSGLKNWLSLPLKKQSEPSRNYLSKVARLFLKLATSHLQ